MWPQRRRAGSRAGGRGGSGRRGRFSRETLAMRQSQKLLRFMPRPAFSAEHPPADIERIGLGHLGHARRALRHGSGTRNIFAAHRGIDRVLEGMVLVAILIDALQRLVASLVSSATRISSCFAFSRAAIDNGSSAAGCCRARSGPERQHRSDICPGSRNLHLALRHLEAISPFLQVLPEGRLSSARYFARFSGVKRNGKLCIWMAFWPPRSFRAPAHRYQRSACRSWRSSRATSRHHAP